MSGGYTRHFSAKNANLALKAQGSSSVLKFGFYRGYTPRGMLCFKCELRKRQELLSPIRDAYASEFTDVSPFTFSAGAGSEQDVRSFPVRYSLVPQRYQ